MMRIARILGSLGLCLAFGCAWGDVRLPNLFGDNMVLQRDRPIPVWGWATPGEEVTVQLGAVIAKAVTNANGEWLVQLPARKDGDGLEMSIAGKNTLTLRGVVVGDIWVCSGQSNMEMNVGETGATADIEAANYPRIRRLKIDHLKAAVSAHDIPRTIGTGFWQVCSPKSAGYFTAAGFYFAREIVNQTGVPIGLFDVNWGSTQIEPWIAPIGLAALPELATLNATQQKELADYTKQTPVQLAKMDTWLADARKAYAESRPAPPLPEMPKFPYACSLYRGMIAPLVRFPIKGVLWYQGEANGDDGDSYYYKMRALVGGWRMAWNQGDFPFYYVQLANWMPATDDPAGGDYWAKIRCAQAKALSIANTGMASAIDIGDAQNIHPKDKQELGKRLARWALARDYGKTKVIPCGPIFREMKIEGHAIRLYFDHLGSGLMVGKKTDHHPAVEDKTGKLARFAIISAYGNWVWANAVIEGDTVVVSSDKVPNPVAVRYAYSMNPAGANLYNREGLPASPFRTDNW